MEKVDNQACQGGAEVIFKPVRVAEVIVITIWCFFLNHEKDDI